MTSASPAVLALVAALAGPGAAYAQAVNLGGNNIVADGRTQTNIEVNGNHTRITTNTVSNGTGFNSFSDFQQAAGTRVDLYVPDNAGNLLNIVRNSRVVIDGVLNGYKNGEIGGNIYFSDSHGFVVGANGVINVGSLTVNTPTGAFLEGVIRPDGSINQLAATQLMNGNVPISPDGIIAIAGTINARGAITLQGHEVSLTGGSVSLDGSAIDQLTMFNSTVNSGGLVEGGALVAHGGTVSIVATGKARVGGRIDVSAQGSGKGGKISVTSAGDIQIDGAARLAADGAGVEGGGGTIDVIAADTLLVEDNAFFGAHATGAAHGGFVELSGKLAEIGSVSLDLGSDRGIAGTLLIDPYDLVIGSATGNFITGGANVSLQADNSITVVSGGIIDTRNATGNAGSITLTSREITVANGAELRADATGSFAAGDITLTAAASGSLLSSSATAAIVIGSGVGAAPIISGRNISLSATAEVDGGIALFDLPTAHATIAINAGQINATGAFSAKATVETTSGLSLLPIGVIVTDVLSSVNVGGTAQITAASAQLTAGSTVVSEIKTQSLAPADSAADGAVAVSTITSDAIVDVSGSAKLTIAGALELAASNDVTSTANATPQAAQFGASVAVSVVDVTTSATIGGAAQVASGSLSLDAQTTTNITVTAAAAAGGASEPQDGSEAKSYLEDDKYAAGTSTSEGSVSVVGGLAISDLTSTTLAQVSSTGVVGATGALSITSATANAAAVTADGSAVDSATGVGVAVGINLAHVSNDAILARSVTAGSLNIAAAMTGDGNVFTTSATSGAGASNVGVAGSLATNLIDTQSSARIASGTATITGGAASLSADNATQSSASGQPTDDGGTGDKIGVGVSAAINIIANRATAELADNAGVTGAGALGLAASGVFTTITDAKAGSAGGISITPALGLSLINNTTTARLGTGSTLSAGSVELTAVQVASTTTTASAAAAGAKAAVGAALALAIVNDQASVTTARSITTTGAVSLVAMGASFSTLTAEASAAGAAATDDSGEQPAGQKDVDGKVDDQFGSAKTKQTNAGIGDSTQQGKTASDVDNKDQRSASTSEGKVTVAAAVGVNVQSAAVSAIVPDAVAITAGGTLTLRSAANADGKITANASAVGGDDIPPAKLGIGAAVAINKVASSNVAQLGVATHSASGLTIEAGKLDVAAHVGNPSSTATRVDSYLASATSGAGGSKVGIAGSLALNLIDTESAARIAAGATVNVTAGGAVTLTADNRTSVTGKALPVGAGASGGKLGVGVSAAINIVANRSTAELADNVVLTGTGALSLAANGDFSASAEAKAGSAGGVSITPALALSMISSTTAARLGSGNTLSAGSVSVGATQLSNVTTAASAKAAGSTASIGASLALALVNDSVVATTGRNVTTTGAVSFTAQGKSTGTLTAEASAAGAKAADDDGNASGEKDVDGKVDDQLGSAKTKQTSAGVGDSAQQGKTSTDVNNKDQRSAKTSEGKVSVAAAVGVNVTSSSVTAVVPDGVAISAGGSLTLASANTTSGSVISDGSATGAQVGIGVAVSVNVVNKTNTAQLGVATHSANGVTIKAAQFGDPANPDVDTYETKATSGAGGSKVGIAGSLALNLINAQASASITSGASVNAKTGASSIVADQRITASASALPSGDGAAGGKVGFGASVALNLITDKTTAALSDGVSFSNGAGLAVTANSTLDTTTAAAAGAKGGVAVDAVVSLASIDQQTIALIGSGTGLNMSGAVQIAATSGGDHKATAAGDTKSGNVGVGAAAAVIIGGGTQDGALANTSVTSASLARNVTAASLAISATSTRTYEAIASATAGGGNENTTTKQSGGSAASADTLDKTKDSQKGTEGGGKVSVAAAVGVAAAQDVVSASIGAVSISTTGAVTVGATNTIDMATIGTGLASKSEVGVSIGVALGIINNSTTASIAGGATITQSGSVGVSATTAENTSAAYRDKLTASAVSGASAKKVSVAGAIAVGISTSKATASIGDNVTITSSGDVAVLADNTSKISAKAVAGSFSSGNASVGASVATVYADHSLTAAIGAGNSITASAVSVKALNHKFAGTPLSLDFSEPKTLLDQLKAAGQSGALLGGGNYYAEAIGGAAATGQVAVQGSFAVMVFSDDVTASVGKSLTSSATTATTINASGAVEIAAQSDLIAKALSGGVAVGSSVGVGVSSTVIDSSGATRALLAGNASITNSASFANTASATQLIQAFGVAAGGAGTAGVGGVASVVLSSNVIEARLGTGASVKSAGAVNVGASSDISTFTLAGGAAAGGTGGVGAGAAVGVLGVTVTAEIGDSASVEAQDVAVAANSAETALTIAVGVGIGGTAGVAGSVSVYSITDTTTARIGTGAMVLADNNVAVLANNTANISFVSGAISGSGTAAVGAAASVALVTTTTLASIDDGAKVTALGKGAAIDYVASYGATLGGSSGDFAPSTPSDYSYDASGNGGEVLSAADAENQGLGLLGVNRTRTPITQSARGVVLNATGGTAVRSLAVGAGISGTVGVTVSANVPIITTAITASIGDNARINVDNNTNPNANQSVVVAAAGDIYRIGLAGALAGSTVGIGGGVDTAFVKPTITAGIGDASTVNAKRDVIVSAKGREDIVGASAAAGAGVTVGIAGAASVLSLDAETTASIGASTVVADGNVAVVAEDITRTSSLAGSIAIGATGGGVGGSIGLALITKRTSASIADNAAITARGNGGDMTVHDGGSFTGTRAARGLLVFANSNESVFTLNVAGAGGLYAGVAGAVSVQLLDIGTTASIGNASINASNSGANAAQDVVVLARDSSSIAAIDGSLAVAAGAIAGAVDIGILKNATSASIGDGANIAAKRRVDVAALQNTSVDSTVISAAGGIVGIAAGVSVYAIGDGLAANGDGNKQITGKNEDGDSKDVGTYVQGQLGDGTVNEVLSSSSDARVNTIGNSVQAARGGLEVKNALTQAAVPGGTSASVGSATITAGGAVAIRSSDAVGTSTTAGAAAAGAVGLGAGIGIVTVSTTNTAQLTGNSTVTGGSVTVDASSNHTLSAQSLAGSLGLTGAAQASLALLTDNSSTRAWLQGTKVVTPGAVVVNATSQRTGSADTRGAAVGGVFAVGVSYAAVNFGGTIEASLGQIAGAGATIGSSGGKVGSVSVTASSTDSGETSATAVSGGIGIAALGSLAETNAGAQVAANVDKATIYASGAVLVSAQSGGRAAAKAYGLALGGLVAAGGSVAHASVAESVATHVFGGTLINAGNISLAASVAPAGTGPAVSSSATGSSGAFVGVTATEAVASNASQATTLAEASTLSATGTIQVAATTTTRQNAVVDGFAGGIVAVGANLARATSNTVTTARLLDLVSVQGGGVQLSATGSDSNVANATSGSGGVIAGAAADAVTGSTSVTRAAIDTSAPTKKFLVAALGGDIDVSATHTASFAGQVNSTQASVVGASGSTIKHGVTSIVDAHLSDDAYVRAANLAISANNLVRNYYIGENAGNTATFKADTAGWNVNSGSGGLVNLPAGSSTTNLIQTTTATIGKRADVHLLPPSSGVSSLSMEAHNDALVHQKGKLDSGGAVALADTSIIINALANATVAVGELSDVIVDIGDIAMAAWSEADLEARAAATTYGLAGAPSGKAYVNYTTGNLADIGANVRLEASNGINPTDGTMPTHGTIGISAGTGLGGQLASISAASTVDLFNKTAIPISTTPDAKSNVTSNANVLIHAATQAYPETTGGYGVNAAGDITIRASRGHIDATAVGTGKDIYLEALAAAASAISNLFGGGDVTFEHHGGSTNVAGAGTVTINGLVATGIRRHQSITFDYDPNCDAATAACVKTGSTNVGYEVTEPLPVGTEILARVLELRELLAQYKDDPVAKGAYQAEISFLEKKLVALGLGEFVAGVFVPGTFAGPSPKAGFLAAAAQNQTDIGTAKNQLAGAVVVTGADSVDWGTSLSKAYTEGTFGLGHNTDVVKTTIAGLSKYAALTDADGDDYSASFVALYGSLAGLVSDGQAAADAVRMLTGTFDADGVPTGGNALHQLTINNLTLDLKTLQDNLTSALIANDAAAITSINSQIATKKLAIQTELTAIASNDAQIATKSLIAKDKAVTLQTALGSLIDQAKTSGNTGDNTKITALNAVSTDPTQAASNGALTQINRSINGFSYTFVDASNLDSNGQPITTTVTTLGVAQLDSKLQSFVTTAGAAITTLNGSGAQSLSGFVTTLSGLGSQYAQNTLSAATAASSSGTPMAYTIDVADTLARLGNISIIGDTLAGTGAISAPGDAKIEITNNTANTLRVGNLIIPSYDAGRVRFNGVIVTGNASINALNATAAAANFASVVTAATSSRPSVTITSNYNGESLSYYNPASPLSYLNTAHIAPDIILASGKTIDNLTGAVNLTSASGNIYVNGTMNAGSVNILAKNGDFVSSYVNGYNHIGGDPASFNSPTRAAEAGKGITANGAISIAARYININSTIQSGIADWNLNLNGAPLLTTTTPESIGLTQASVDAALSAYKAALQAALTDPSTTPSTRIDMGNGIVLNMAPAGVDTTDLSAKIKDYLTVAKAGGPLPNPVVAVALTGGGTVTVNIKDFLSPTITGRLEFSVATAETYLTGHSSATGVYGVIAPSSNIGVSYDAKNVQYVVDGTSVRGGYIQLYGQIMNTASSGGQLNVLDGFGTINITNSGNIPVVLQTLSAGADTTGTGRGTAGVIDIMDVRGVNVTNPASPVVSVRHTVYTRDYDPAAGTAGSIRIATQDGTIDNISGNFVGAGSVAITAGGNRTATYQTAANQRYVWTTGQYYDNTTYLSVKQTQLFGSSALTVSENTVFDRVDGPHTLNTYRLLDGTYVTVDATQVGNSGVLQTNRGIILVSNPATVGNDTLAGAELVTSTYAYMNEQTGPNETGRRRDCNWWTLCIASNVTINYTLNQKYTVVSTNSLKADNPIAINFIGSDTGAITVKSNKDVVLTGNVSAAAGDVTICAGGIDCNALSGTGSIIQGNIAAQITGKNVTLEAAGSVGGVTYTGAVGAPLNGAIAVSLTGGKLNASAADGNVAITTRGDLTIGRVTAAGDVVGGKGAVNLVAAGSIKAANSSSFIQAPRVSLTALNGSIGSTANGQQLLVNTGFSTTPSLRQFGDPALDSTINPNPYLGLTATAGGDIGIRSTAWSGNADGTMLLDKVLSIGGDVRLSSTGYILDNNPVESVDSRTYDQLLSYWNSLALLDGSDENLAKQEATILAYERSTTQLYRQYWQIRQTQGDGGAAYDASYVYRVQPETPQYRALERQFDADVRAANPGYSDSQVATAVAQKFIEFGAAQTDLYRDLNAKIGGLTTSFDDGFSYEASVTEKADLTRKAGWTEKELAFSLSPGALKTVTATNPIVKAPNVAGRTVTIAATKGVGETVGAGTATPGVRIAGNLDPRLLTIEQKVALAAAERSDIVLNILYGGVIVDVPLGTDYSDLTSTQQAALNAAAATTTFNADDITITILSKRPLNFDAKTALNVTVTDAPTGAPISDLGKAYLASRTDALLGAISVQGETRMKTIGSIGNAAGGSLIATGNLILEAAQGGIGTSGTPVQLALLSGSTFTARAQNGVFVNLSGDARIDTVYSPGNIRITATGSLLNANKDDLINILGTNVSLTASAGSIGSITRALNVGNNIGGGITASASGLINLYGPARNLFTLKSVTSTAGGIRLTAGFEGIIDGSVSALGQIDLAAGGRWVVSGQAAIHSTTGMIEVSAASLKMIDGATMTADIGRIAITTTGNALVTGISSGASDSGGHSAVEIVSGGRVLAGNASARPFDIKADAVGASVAITAALGIGDKTQANQKWQDGLNDVPGSANAITNTPNPLRILTSTATLEATEGDIYASLLSDPVTVSAKAGDGNIYLTAAGDFHGALLEALKGTVSVEAEGDITVDILRALKVVFDTAGTLKLSNVEVAEEASFGAGVLDISIKQVPSGPDPLKLTLTGYKGGLGTSAHVVVDAPAGLVMPKYSFIDGDITTTARSVRIEKAFVPGSLWLKTPATALLYDNRSPAPQRAGNVQMYAPNAAFTLDLNNAHTTTNAYVVRYDATAQVTEVINGVKYEGASLVRDTIRAMYHDETTNRFVYIIANTGVSDEIQAGDSRQGGRFVVIDGIAYPVIAPADGPAVHLSQLN